MIIVIIIINNSNNVATLKSSEELVIIHEQYYVITNKMYALLVCFVRDGGCFSGRGREREVDCSGKDYSESIST